MVASPLVDGQRWAPGRIVADRYQLVAPIGRGGMGVVWRAEHTRLGAPVAVKILHDDVAEQADAGPRFLREAQACAAIRGPHVVQVLDFGLEDGVPYLAMELLEGEPLRDRLDREGHLSHAAAVRVVGQVAKGIGRAHARGIVHRDLKPANIHLCPDEGDEIVKVLDFGLAKVVEGTPLASRPLTITGTVMGTASYMSPEQARGRMDLDHRADLWSLGIIAFQCLTGRLPLTGRTEADLLVKICTEPMPPPTSLAPDLPPSIDAWFARATRRSPGDRFQSAAEMSEALAAALPATD
ncbi:MAG: serine/threonine-protein kinase [Polyangiaceae bacterium]